MTRISIPELGTILGVWAHPDDEAYLTAGVMALAREAGQRVVVATATRGEAGTPDPELWPARRLGRLREHELHASLAALDVHEHHFLGYVDGTLAEQDAAAGVLQIASLIEEVRPDTIITFGPEGMTGHDDHCTVSQWTMEARNLVAPTTRVLFPIWTADRAARWADFHERFDVFMAPGLPLTASEDELALQLEVDGALADRKLVALRAQASQTAGIIDAVGEPTYRAWAAAMESFVLAPAAPASPASGLAPATAATV